MRAGLLRHQVWADEPVATQNETGEEIIAWTPRGKIWCSIEPIGGREVMRANQIIADMDTRIVARWSLFAAQINAKWRLRFERTGVVYNISRPPAERRLLEREIEFMCSSGLVGEGPAGDPVDTPMLDFSSVGNSQYIPALHL